MKWSSKARATPTAVVRLVEAPRHNTGDLGFDSRWGPWKLSSDLILLSAFSSPGIPSACNRNELCSTSCAECQSKYGNSIFHPSSESPWLVQGNIYIPWTPSMVVRNFAKPPQKMFFFFFWKVASVSCAVIQETVSIYSSSSPMALQPNLGPGLFSSPPPNACVLCWSLPGLSFQHPLNLSVHCINFLWAFQLVFSLLYILWNLSWVPSRPSSSVYSERSKNIGLILKTVAARDAILAG